MGSPLCKVDSDPGFRVRFIRSDAPTVTINGQRPLTRVQAQTSEREPFHPCAQRTDHRSQRFTSCRQPQALAREARNLAVTSATALRATPACLRAKGSAWRATICTLRGTLVNFALRGSGPCASGLFACARGHRGGAQGSQVCTQRIRRCARVFFVRARREMQGSE